MPVEDTSCLRTLRDVFRYAVSSFNRAGLSFGHGSDNAFDEAAYLVLHALSLPLDRLEPFMDATLTPTELESTLSLIKARIEKRVPAAYLTGEAWLGTYRFHVDERVIVPRSHIAELLREQLSPWVTEPDNVRRALDLCTGSGCLAILLAETFPAATIDATELSPDALEVARKNVAEYSLQKRVSLHQGDGFGALTARYDVIVANPPYVDTAAMAALSAEYRAEPAMALAGGEDGLDIVRRIITEAAAHLTPDGILVVEIGNDRPALEKAYPGLRFVWLETAAGEDFVFLLSADDLRDLGA